MPASLAVLDAFPGPEKFFQTYWNKKPFLARGAIAQDILSSLIEPDELAGLALEEDVISRLVKTKGAFENWSCQFGPFEADDFTNAGDESWSLLVQNVEQFHPPTAELLRCFAFAPRWMIDDVMVSYSVPGGSVGPHLDSYHVFLVQGAGRRKWKIGDTADLNPAFSDHPDLKILASSFSGSSVEVEAGDVLYVPPDFAHEGTTLEEALTFSVGFLGPKISELFGAYARHLAENEQLDTRYKGDAISSQSQNHTMETDVIAHVKTRMTKALEEDFARWLTIYFTEPSIEVEVEHEMPVDAPSPEDLRQRLEDGGRIQKIAGVKMAYSGSGSNDVWVAVNGRGLACNKSANPLLTLLAEDAALDISDMLASENRKEGFLLLSQLFRLGALEWVS